MMMMMIHCLSKSLYHAGNGLIFLRVMTDIGIAKVQVGEATFKQTPETSLILLFTTDQVFTETILVKAMFLTCCVSVHADSDIVIHENIQPE